MPGMVFDTDKRGFVNSSGPQWREQRRFALTTLRNFGIGKSSIEPAIQNELLYFLQAIEAQQGEPVDIATHISESICNVICILEYGKRFEYNDPYFIKLNNAISNYLHYTTSTGIYAVFPWLKYIPGANKIGNLDKVRHFGKILHDFGTKMMKEHREVYVPGSKDDYINAHFTETVERNNNGNYPEFFDDVCIENNLRVLFIGGTETSTTTLLWAILFMILHPDVQRKVQAELDEVIGRQRLPCCADRPNLPFTEATLLEIQRRGSIAPLGIPRRTMQDVDFKGFKIPKDTTVISNIWSAHHEEKVFPDPFTFRPERHLNSTDQVSRVYQIIPFSIGKRNCIGEELARMEVFLYFAHLMHKFTFKLPPGDTAVMDEVPSIVNAPTKYRVIAITREE